MTAKAAAVLTAVLPSALVKTANIRGCGMVLSRATRFNETLVAGIDAIVRGEGNRAILCVGLGRP